MLVFRIFCIFCKKTGYLFTEILIRRDKTDFAKTKCKGSKTKRSVYAQLSNALPDFYKAKTPESRFAMHSRSALYQNATFWGSHPRQSVSLYRVHVHCFSPIQINRRYYKQTRKLLWPTVSRAPGPKNLFTAPPCS